MAAVEAALERAGAGARRGRALRPRHDRRHQRPARGRGARARRWSPPRASPTSSSSAARPAPTSTACAPPTRAARAARAARRRARADDARTARCARSTTTRRDAASSAVARARARGGRRRACCTPTATPSTSGASATALARAPAGRARVALARGRRHVPRVRARRDDRGRRLPLPAAAPLPAPPRRARARRRACPSPPIMQSSGGLADARRSAARARRAGPCSRAPPAARPAPPAPPRAAGEPRRAVLRHGRHVVRRLRRSTAARVREAAGREIGGRPLALPMLDVHTVGAGGGSIAWRDAGRRAARRPALGGRRARARLLRPRRRPSRP